jgi:hypothetical protein
MKKIKFPFLLMVIFLLAACTPAAEQVMPSLQYKQSVDFHISKNATLIWEIGRENASTIPTAAVNGDALATIIAMAIISQDRKNNPGKYTLTYGKAQQAVFMTSLKDVLQKNQVFKHIELAITPKKMQANDVFITINFKSTRVSAAENNHKIILDVELIIKTVGNKIFKRTYLVESNPGDFFSQISFKDQQTDVSLQLLSKVITGIKQWHTQFNQ